MWHTRSASDRPASAEVCGPCQPAVQGSLPSTPSDTLSDMHWSLWSLAMVVRRQRRVTGDARAWDGESQGVETRVISFAIDPQTTDNPSGSSHNLRNGYPPEPLLLSRGEAGPDDRPGLSPAAEPRAADARAAEPLVCDSAS